MQIFLAKLCEVDKGSLHLNVKCQTAIGLFNDTRVLNRLYFVYKYIELMSGDEIILPLDPFNQNHTILYYMH
jgi:hypothetical protein